jgi:hypothetical protein
MMDKIIFIAVVFAFGFLMGLDVQEAKATRETDAQKWDRIEANRSLRRHNEAQYMSCLKSCLKD